MAARRPGGLAPWKRALFALSPALLLFGGLEAGLTLLWDDDGAVRLRNRHDPGGRSVLLDERTAESLPETLRMNLQDNVLTYPDPELLFRVRPNPGGGRVHGYQGINALGFRGRPLVPAADDERVVLVVGDSSAFGWGVHQLERTFAVQLERILDRRAGPHAVFNLGQPGYSSHQARMLYERWAPRLDPDVVVIYQGWNDLWESAGGTDREILQRLRWANQPPLGWVFRSHTYRLVASLLLPLRPTERARADEGRRVPMAESVENHRALLADARRRGALTLVVPPSFSARGDRSLWPMRTYNAQLREALAGEVRFVEVPEMQPTQASSPRFFLADGFHPNVLGSRRLALAVAESILVPPAAAQGTAPDRPE